MTWDPTAARTLLNGSSIVKFQDELSKLSVFKFDSKREIALLEENKFKVSIYLSCAPCNMPDVVIDEEYHPTSEKSGRHSNLQVITQTLGFGHKAFKVEVKSMSGLVKLLEWYQYA